MEKAKIQIGLGQMEQAAGIVAEIANTHKFKKVADSYWFGRTTQVISKIFEKMSRVKNQLIQDYAQKDEKGFFKSGPGGIQIPPEKKEEFKGKLDEVYDLRETRDVFLIELEALEGTEFTAQQITPLMGLWIKEPAVPEDPPGNTTKETGPQNGKAEESPS